MVSVQTEDQCQHPGCGCARPATGDYCGDHCADAGQGGMQGKCECGHPECK